jgi:hypothetical protein
MHGAVPSMWQAFTTVFGRQHVKLTCRSVWSRGVVKVSYTASIVTRRTRESLARRGFSSLICNASQHNVMQHTQWHTGSSTSCGRCGHKTDGTEGRTLPINPSASSRFRKKNPNCVLFCSMNGDLKCILSKKHPCTWQHVPRQLSTRIHCCYWILCTLGLGPAELSLPPWASPHPTFFAEAAYSSMHMASSCSARSSYH